MSSVKTRHQRKTTGDVIDQPLPEESRADRLRKKAGLEPHTTSVSRAPLPYQRRGEPSPSPRKSPRRRKQKTFLEDQEEQHKEEKRDTVVLDLTPSSVGHGQLNGSPQQLAESDDEDGEESPQDPTPSQAPSGASRQATKDKKKTKKKRSGNLHTGPETKRTKFRLDWMRGDEDLANIE
eukprot:scaffold8157_cov515-Pinguiococcus_pyrenoidosus.AAC.1